VLQPLVSGCGSAISPPPYSSHLLPFPCLFDELLGTDHLVSGKYFTSEYRKITLGT